MSTEVRCVLKVPRRASAKLSDSDTVPPTSARPVLSAASLNSASAASVASRCAASSGTPTAPSEPTTLTEARASSWSCWARAVVLPAKRATSSTLLALRATSRRSRTPTVTRMTMTSAGATRVAINLVPTFMFRSILGLSALRPVRRDVVPSGKVSTPRGKVIGTLRSGLENQDPTGPCPSIGPASHPTRADDVAPGPTSGRRRATGGAPGMTKLARVRHRGRRTGRPG